MDPLIQVRELSKVYPQGGRNVIALNRVSLGIKAAESSRRSLKVPLLILQTSN